ncbi:hypothetical protein JHK86_044749 [Glycine max]|nr:hypothetical protein JHK86_044749 [Glycine max]
MWVSREQFPADFRQEEKEKSDFRKEDDKEKREGKVFEHARLFAHASRKKVIEGSCEEEGERGGGEDLRGGSGKDGRGIGVAETERGNGGNNCLSPRSRGARLCPMQGGSRKRWWWLYHREQ